MDDNPIKLRVKLRFMPLRCIIRESVSVYFRLHKHSFHIRRVTLDFILSHAHELGSFLGGLVVGAAGGSLITLRIARQNRVPGSGSIADQSRARAGGDIAGRDKTVRLR
jgi:hypothetical protein